MSIIPTYYMKVNKISAFLYFWSSLPASLLSTHTEESLINKIPGEQSVTPKCIEQHGQKTIFNENNTR